MKILSSTPGDGVVRVEYRHWFRRDVAYVRGYDLCTESGRHPGDHGANMLRSAACAAVEREQFMDFLLSA